MHRQPAAENVPPLRVYWELRQATMRFPGADIGATGIALAKSLRLAGDPASLDEAGRILDHIRANDPDKSRVEIARAEQLSVDFTRSLATGKLEETDKLAWKITEETDDQARAQITKAREGQDDPQLALAGLISGTDTWTIV